ncbi:MAG: hypothetical protein V3V31_00715 [Methylococcales bacterium]
MIKKSDSKWVSLATVSILGQPPSPSRISTSSKWAFLNAKGIPTQSLIFNSVELDALRSFSETDCGRKRLCSAISVRTCSRSH